MIQISERYKLQIIQTYAPTSTHEDEEVVELYEEINKLIGEEKAHFKIIMGDFNAQVGKKKDEDETSVGNYGYKERNDRGDLLVEFAQANQLKIANTFFKKKYTRKWTWKSPMVYTKTKLITYCVTNSNRWWILQFSTDSQLEVTTD